jgi:hypothetical protein
MENESPDDFDISGCSRLAECIIGHEWTHSRQGNVQVTIQRRVPTTPWPIFFIGLMTLFPGQRLILCTRDKNLALFWVGMGASDFSFAHDPSSLSYRRLMRCRRASLRAVGFLRKHILKALIIDTVV